MKLSEAYEIIYAIDSDAVLHHDHICSDPGVHDAGHCPAGDPYHKDDAARDTERALAVRLAAAGYGS